MSARHLTSLVALGLASVVLDARAEPPATRHQLVDPWAAQASFKGSWRIAEIVDPWATPSNARVTRWRPLSTIDLLDPWAGELQSRPPRAIPPREPRRR